MKAVLALDEVIRTRGTVLVRSASLLTDDWHLAEDLVQAALAKAIPRWAKIADNPEPYIRRILYHEHISLWRRRRVAEDLMSEVTDHGRSESGSDAEEVEVRMLVHRALARLTARQRAVLVLRYFEDLTEARTAELLNCSVGTVKSQTRHALRRLRELSPELAELAPRPDHTRATGPVSRGEHRTAA